MCTSGRGSRSGPVQPASDMKPILAASLSRARSGREPAERRAWRSPGLVDTHSARAAASATYGRITGGLFGAIAVQPAFAVAKTDGISICSECGRPYLPRRKPQEGAIIIVATANERLRCVMRRVIERDGNETKKGK